MMPDSNFQDGDFEKALLLESHNLFKTLNCISGCEADLDKMRCFIGFVFLILLFSDYDQYGMEVDYINPLL